MKITRKALSGGNFEPFRTIHLSGFTISEMKRKYTSVPSTAKIISISRLSDRNKNVMSNSSNLRNVNELIGIWMTIIIHFKNEPSREERCRPTCAKPMTLP